MKSDRLVQTLFGKPSQIGKSNLTNMKPTNNLFIKVMICCCWAKVSGFSIRRQKGTFSEANLCKIGKGTIVRKARSSIECFTKCLILLPNLCKSVKFMPEEQICNMYQEGFRYDYYETENNSCMGYQLIKGNNFGLANNSNCLIRLVTYVGVCFKCHSIYGMM